MRYQSNKILLMDKNVEVLVVDDDLAAAQTFAELIEAKYHFGTDAYSDHKKVMEIIRTGTVKVVVLDERMPNMNGTDLFKEIHQINPNIQAVLLTGEADRSDIIKATKLGYSDYLEKSNISELPGKVMVAYAQYEVGIIKQSNEEQSLSIINPLKTRFGFYRYTVCSVELVDKAFIFEDGWKTQLALVSSELTQEYSYEYTKECRIMVGTESKESANIGLEAGKLASLKSQLDTVVTSHIDSSLSLSVTHKKKITQTYKLQDGVEEGKQAIKKIYDSNPIFYKFNVLLKKYCRLCGNVQIFPIEVYKRIPKEKTRVQIFYADGFNRVIETGYVSIQ